MSTLDFLFPTGETTGPKGFLLVRFCASQEKWLSGQGVASPLTLLIWSFQVPVVQGEVLQP